MYVDRLLKVAEAIETNSIPNVEFDMRWFNGKSISLQNRKRCIAGYIDEMFSDEILEIRKGRRMNVFQSAARVILVPDEEDNLNEEEYKNMARLFFPPRTPKTTDYSKITREQAGKTIRRFIETGVVDWEFDVKVDR